MTDALSQRTGKALGWRGLEQLGVKLVFLIRTPVLARLLAPEDFGLLAIGLVSLDILMRLTEVGMIQALVQKEDIGREHYRAAWSVGFLRALIVTTIVFLFAPAIAALFGDPRAAPIIRVLALRPILMALASIGVVDLIRDLRFKGLAFMRLADVLLDATLAIGLAPFVGVWALPIGALAGPVAGTVISYLIVPRAPRLRFDRSAAHSLIRFGRWILVTGVMTLAGRFILEAVISRQLGTAELGLYYIAVKIAFTLSEVSFSLVAAVAFPLFSRLQSERERAEETFRALLHGLVVVLLPIAGLLIALAPSIVRDVLGPQWLGSEHVIQVLVVAALLGSFANVLSPVFDGLGRPSNNALLAGLRTVVLSLLAWEAAGRFGLVGAAMAWLPALGITGIVGYGLIRTVFTNPLQGLTKWLLSMGVVSVAGSGVAFVVEAATPGLLGLGLAGGAGGATIVVLMVGVDRLFDLDLAGVLRLVSPRLASFVGRRSQPSAA